MDAYIKGVIVMGAVCSILLMTLHRDGAGKYVRYISQLAILLVLLAPISGVFNFVSSLRTELPEQTVGESAAAESVISGAADNISKYIAETCAEKFSLDPVNIKVRLILDESDTENIQIEEIQIFTDETRSDEKKRIKNYFEDLLQTEVFVFGP